MKYIITLAVLLFTILQFNNLMAAESITGTWQGKLITGPGAEMNIQFIINKEDNGSYSVILNSPDEGAIKNIKASAVVFKSGVLQLDVPEFNGSYEGVLRNGTIDGKWKQEGQSFDLALRPYEKPILSKKDIDKLLGTWQGKPEMPKPTNTPTRAFIGQTFAFRFEISENDEFVGFFGIPDMTPIDMPIYIEMSDESIILKGSRMGLEYKGKFEGDKIVGEIKTSGSAVQTLTLKKE